MWSEEQKCLLWLSSAEVSADRVHSLLEKYGSAQEIWEAFGTAGRPIFSPRTSEILGKWHSRDALEDLIDRLQRQRVHVLFQKDALYPELLNAIDDPPYLLYYMGDLKGLVRPMVAVVGTRIPSRYGKEMAFSIAQGLADVGVGVVSGLARGIDSSAHEGALKAQGVTIAVLGSGLNVCYPPEKGPLLRAIVEGGGLALSEYPLDAEPVNYHFPHRNRVIAGLSHGLVFVEGKVQSGGMTTVFLALKQGREVFAVPGQVGTSGSEGPHAILREGARLVTCAGDILEDLSITLAPSQSRPGAMSSESPTEEAILSALGREAMGLDALCKTVGVSEDEMIAQLSVMEITGQVVREAGNVFRLSLLR
ncbi:MAG: DNA-protecting protein DprA [Clostridiales bacterium]|nr:DNA-protecting protein DprA [Clostridiales bacterium]